MNWRLFLTVFGTLFLAEMGDKTQLAVVTMSAATKKPWVVFLGACLALTLVSALGAAAGGLLTRWVPERLLTKIAAALFVAIGLWTWFKG